MEKRLVVVMAGWVRIYVIREVGAAKATDGGRQDAVHGRRCPRNGIHRLELLATRLSRVFPRQGEEERMGWVPDG